MDKEAGRVATRPARGNVVYTSQMATHIYSQCTDFLFYTNDIARCDSSFYSQLGWALVPKYLAKHYPGYFCEGAFWRRLTLKSVGFE